MLVLQHCTSLQHRKKMKMLPVLQDLMPLQCVYAMALEQDIKNSVASRKTLELLQNRCYQVRFRPRLRPSLQRTWIDV